MTLIDRREFLSTSRAAVASAAFGLAVSGKTTHAGENTSKLKKAVKYHMIKDGKLSVVDKFKLLQDLGFDGVEIHRREKTDPREFVKAREKTGLPIHGALNSSNPDLAGALDLAKLYGATSVLYVAGRVNEKKRYDVNYKETQEII